MATKYTLGRNLETSFDYGVVIDGKTHVYNVKYPSQKELRPIQQGYARLQELDKEYSKTPETAKKKREELEAEVKNVSEEMTNAFNALFTPVDDAMPLDDMLDNLPSNQKHVFDLMIRAELLDDKEAKEEIKEYL